MPSSPKDLIGAALGLGRRAVGAGAGAAGRLRGGGHAAPQAPADDAAPSSTGEAGTSAAPPLAGARTSPSPPPDVLGAPRPGQAGGHKSSTASTSDRPGGDDAA